jgi:hypothetical protein
VTGLSSVSIGVDFYTSADRSARTCTRSKRQNDNGTGTDKRPCLRSSSTRMREEVRVMGCKGGKKKGKKKGGKK